MQLFRNVCFVMDSIWLIQMKEIHKEGLKNGGRMVHETSVIWISRDWFISREKMQVQIDVYFLNRGILWILL